MFKGSLVHKFQRWEQVTARASWDLAASPAITSSLRLLEGFAGAATYRMRMQLIVSIQ
jgi:hypothetical protein